MRPLGSRNHVSEARHGHPVCRCIALLGGEFLLSAFYANGGFALFGVVASPTRPGCGLPLPQAHSFRVLDSGMVA